MPKGEWTKLFAFGVLTLFVAHYSGDAAQLMLGTLALTAVFTHWGTVKRYLGV